jgi:hypothetical protein
MLQLLLVLPQEAGSYRPAVRPERRRQMYDELKASFPVALAVLTKCLSDSGASANCVCSVQALKCRINRQLGC